MSEKEQAIPVVSAIIERGNNNNKEILMQIRWKHKDDPKYTGTIELPAGTIKKYENIAEALKREVKEETGLDIKIKNLKTSKTYSPQGDDKAFAFISFCGQQQLKEGKPAVGFVFICEVVGGEIKPQKDEVKDVRWVPINEVREMLKNPEKLFALQIGALELYLASLD